MEYGHWVARDFGRQYLKSVSDDKKAKIKMRKSFVKVQFLAVVYPS
jgi:hypothetical protein